MSRAERQNPLLTVWQVISTISGIIGLASMTDDIVAWKSFIPQVLDAYRSVVHPVFAFLIEWIPGLQLDGWVRDYLFVGLLVSGSRLRAFHANPLPMTSDMREEILKDRVILRSAVDKFSEKKAGDSSATENGRPQSKDGWPTAARLGFYIASIVLILVWPLILTSMIFTLTNRKTTRESVSPFRDWTAGRNIYAFRFLGALILGLSLLLMLNLALR